MTATVYHSIPVKRELRTPLAQALGPLVLNLCRYPEDCCLVERVDGAVVDLVITPNRADFRVICGKGGRQIKALKYFAKRMGELSHPFFYGEVHLEEGVTGTPEPVRPFVQDPEFDVSALLSDIHSAAFQVMGRIVPFTHERHCDKLFVEFAVDPNDPEDVPAVLCLSDLFYPATFRRGMLCEIRPRKGARPF